MDRKNLERFAVVVIIAIIIIAGVAVFAPHNNSAVSVSQKGSNQVASVALTRNVTNVDGSTFIVPANITKIGCLWGPSYEKVMMLGAGEKVNMIGDSNLLWPWSKVVYRKHTNNPTIIKNWQNANIEDILKDKPDVIFFATTPLDLIRKMEDAGITVVSFTTTNKFNDTKTQLKVYADVLGPDAQARSDEYSKYFDEKLAMVSSRTADIPENQRPTVYYAIRKPLQTAGKTSDISEMITLAGGRSVTGNLTGGFGFDINMEQLLQWNPDYIIIDHCGASNLGSKPSAQTLAEMANDTRFSDLSAMKNGHVDISPTGVFFWDVGQQKILQLIWLAKILHPDKFQDIDMNREVKEFYHKFFDYDLTDDEADRILRLLPPQEPGGK